ncbi:MAG: lipoyl(octanoyl) transferase LipB [Bdellovibrio sp.]|nr:lipoyl(octanoyl) transferase LipB [Bdellovibrio sp.]
MTALNFINKNSFQIESSYLGSYDYQRAELLQLDLYQLALKKQFSVIGLEHPAVLTLGHRATLQDEVLFDSIPVVRSSRGGLATIHSEGQLVIYPILDLRALGIGVKDYVRLLMKTTQALLTELKIDSSIDDQVVGLNTVNGKIAFCGIQIKNGISQHGISLNVRNDLKLFNSIRACGMENLRLDRLANWSVDASLSELFTVWNRIFKVQLERLGAAD